MNYKTIFRSQKFRFLILRLLAFIPDSCMLKIQYRLKLNRRLDLSKPKRFTEKLQWYKLEHRDPIMGKCVDKYQVREYVKSKNLESILCDIYGVYSDVEEIDFEMLPARFVIKTTDGSGGENILICKDKLSLDLDDVRAKLASWKNKKDVNAGREWAYTCIEKTRYIVEEFLENDQNPEAGISDFKFLCFKGKPFCVVYDKDRYIGHKRNFYDMGWNNLSVVSDCPGFDDAGMEKPKGFDEMVRVAEVLSADFPFVRVDLYYLRDQVYFGELTFYPWSGYVQFVPDDFDFDLGRQFETN